jgi:hypothetical protein
MEIDLTKYGGAPELGYELLSIVPYACRLAKQGLLTKTVSGKDTAPFYYFSPNHVEVDDLPRGWKYMQKYVENGFPNIQIHRKQLDWQDFLPPLYTKYFIDKAILFKKETLVICNRYNVEWGEKPINYFDLPTLRSLFDMLKDNYQIVYCNLGGIDELKKYDDDAPAMPLGDYDMIKKEYPEVIHIYDLHKERDLSINETQMRVFAGCSKYITMNGGYGIWASYMQGENVIYSKRCREIGVNSFYTWYWKLSQSTVQHVSTYKDLLHLVKEKWVDKLPLINILLRTSNREDMFNRAVDSIEAQTYKNIRIVVHADNDASMAYAMKRRVNPVQFKPYANMIPIGMFPYYGKPFGPNMYFPRLFKYVNNGIIMYLDDDDYYIEKTAFQQIADLRLKYRDIAIWRVIGKQDQLIPNNYNFLESKWPEPGDFSGLGIAHHHENLPKWEPYRRGDYRIAMNLYRNAYYDKCAIHKINEPLVKAGL